jgi:uncharacterized damage-inducible protein DinB
MPSCADLLRFQLDYDAWASRRLVAAATVLSSEELDRDFGTADRSVLGTLVHVFAADRLWLARLNGDANPPYTTPADYRLSVLETDWPKVHDHWRTWLAGLTEEVGAGEFNYHDMKGRVWRQPLWQLVFHVVNHGTHHRGQTAGFLRALGRIPPALDMTVYYRESGSNYRESGSGAAG